VSAETADPRETLAREERDRPRAGGAAILAGLATIAGTLILTAASSGAPTGTPATVLDALDARLAGRPVDSLTVRVVEFFGDRAALLVLSAVLLAAGVALTGYALAYLFRAVQARNPAAGRVGIIATVVAAVAYPVGHLVSEVLRWTGAAGFDGTTAQAARDAVQSGTIAVGALLDQLGLFALAVGLVVIVLNALRVGLVTRLMGILGILAGVLALFPIDRGIIRSFWLVSLGFVILGRKPAVQPPAWRTGRAEPWPTQQQLREARGGGAAAPPPEREPERARPAAAAGAVAAGASDAAQRRKRKRRR
jgi:hypothetical protein